MKAPLDRPNLDANTYILVAIREILFGMQSGEAGCRFTSQPFCSASGFLPQTQNVRLIGSLRLTGESVNNCHDVALGWTCNMSRVFPVREVKWLKHGCILERLWFSVERHLNSSDPWWVEQSMQASITVTKKNKK